VPRFYIIDIIRSHKHKERCVAGAGMRVAYGAAAFLWSCVFTARPVPLSVSSLPRDEYEASIMIGEGQIDSLDWEQLRQFYVQPINVPSGELRYLKELTDLRVSDPPVSSSKLAPYEPWTPADIERFFKDYPNLVPFEPILSFEASPVSHSSDASLSVHADQNMRPTALSRFDAVVDQRLSFSGSAYHRDSTVQWRTRALDIALAGVARFEAGNFDVSTDEGLFFGYFPDDKENQTTERNWLFGGTRTWNGIGAVSDRWQKFQVCAIYHERPTENVQQISCKADFSEAINVDFGASRMAQTGLAVAPDSAYYIQCGVGGRIAGFNMVANTGVDVSHPYAIPFSCQAGRKSANGFVNLLVARIPGDLKLPMSSIAYLCRHDLGASTWQDSSLQDMTLLECRTALYRPAGIETSMDLSSVIHGRTASMQATVSAQGRSVVDYRVEYGCLATTDRPSMAHNINFTLKKALPAAHLTAHFSCRYFCKDSGFQSVFLRVPLDIAIMPTMTVTPFITLNSNTDGERAASIGLKQTLYCFEKTWCDWSGQISRDERNVAEWEVDVRTNFLF
jgi:hypothetical protein